MTTKDIQLAHEAIEEVRGEKEEQEQKTREEKEIYTICNRCGVCARVVTYWDRFKEFPPKLCWDCSTWHVGICDWCGEERSITEARDFFHPDWTHIKSVYHKKKM
jgi:hypothetical protein